MKFNHLNVPDQWQHYWTKYPEGLTILEALISWVSQVDDMVDNQNKLNANVEQFRKEIDDFVGRFDERLQDEVTHTLKDWQSSGFLDVVISTALQWQLDDYITTNEQDKRTITTQLEQKANRIEVYLKSQGISINDLDEETRGIILNMEPGEVNAVLGEGNVTEKNLQDFVVSARKTRFMNATNLGALVDYERGKIMGSDGAVVNNPDFLLTDFVEVNFNEPIYIHDARNAMFYNSSKARQGYIFNSSGGNKVVSKITPVENGYLRFTIYDRSHPPIIARQPFDIEDIQHDYELDNRIQVTSDNLDIVKLNKIEGFEKVNLFEEEKATKHKILQIGTGTPIDSYVGDFKTSDFIPFKKGDTIYINQTRIYAIFDTTRNFVETVDNPPNGSIERSMTVDGYLRTSADINYPVMVTRNVAFSEYVGEDVYRPINNKIKLSIDQIDGGGNTVRRFSNKKILFMGDSLIRNYSTPNTIPNVFETRLGCETLNAAFGGSKMSYFEDRNSTPLSFSRLVNSFVTGDFTEAETYINGQAEHTKVRSLQSLNTLKTTDFATVDYGVILIGINDYLQSAQLGEATSFDTNTYKGAYNHSIKTLQSNFPQMKLILVAPPYQDRADEDPDFDVDVWQNASGYKLIDYVKADEEIANLNKLPFINLFTESGINKYNRDHYFDNIDGVHPTNQGIVEVGNVMVSQFESKY